MCYNFINDHCESEKIKGKIYMLNIFLGSMPQAIYNTAVYFKNAYEEEWIISPLTKEMV